MLRFTLAKRPLPFTRPKIQQKNQSMESGQLKKTTKKLYLSKKALFCQLFMAVPCFSIWVLPNI
jgi:hypothetical protein